MREIRKKLLASSSNKVQAKGLPENRRIDEIGKGSIHIESKEPNFLRMKRKRNRHSTPAGSYWPASTD